MEMDQVSPTDSLHKNVLLGFPAALSQAIIGSAADAREPAHGVDLRGVCHQRAERLSETPAGEAFTPCSCWPTEANGIQPGHAVWQPSGEPPHKHYHTCHSASAGSLDVYYELSRLA